jgi:hypothetical protein
MMNPINIKSRSNTMPTLVNQVSRSIKSAVIKPKSSRQYLDVNVILTFDTSDEFGNTQEFFDLKIPLSKYEKNAESFLDQKFFKRVIKYCAQHSRDIADLIKISTASNWSLFKEVTGKQSLSELGHSCKWYFGSGRSDLDAWEQHLMKTYGFGSKVDMSWVDSLTMDSYFQKYCQDRVAAQII